MIELPLLIASSFRYRSQIAPEPLGAGPECCACGDKLWSYEAKRSLFFHDNRLWSKNILVKRCMPCQRYYLRVGFVSRWFTVMSFLAICVLIWVCLASIPIMFLWPTIENMYEVDWEIVGAWGVYGLVAGGCLYATGRALGRRVVNAGARRLVEVDDGLGRSV